MLLQEKRIDLILQQLEELPTLPAVAMQVLTTTGDKASSARQVVKIVASDPALSARILQLVHRADNGVRGEITSIERAVVLLGFDAIRSAVLAVSIFRSFGEKSADAASAGFNRDEFWKHCVAVACCAELLVEPIRGQGFSPSDAFICGLLHDLGKIALDTVLPKSFGRVIEASDLLRGNIADIERKVIGLDHMVVGKRLAEKWNLPPLIRDCIWLHGQAPSALPASVRNPRMVNIITLADQIVRQQHLGYSGNYLFALSRQSLLDATGLTPQQVEAVTQKLVGCIEPRARFLGLGVASTSDLYQQALAQANKELGHLNGQLATKNRKLAARAQFFESLSKFQSEVRPDSSPRAVLTTIAQAAIELIGTPSAAAFSLPPASVYAETLTCNQEGQIVEHALVDLPAESSAAGETADASPDQAASARVRPSLPRTGEGPVLQTGVDLEWMVSVISPRLAQDGRFWICLEIDGQCVGGVVWGGAADEAQRLGPLARELAAIANGWAIALRMAQIREEGRALAEQLAEANRNLQNAQSEVLRSRTLMTVGEMAAGAAHEMNNPLAVISGRSQLLSQQIEDPKTRASAHLIYEQAHRLSGIITDMMEFAKPEPAVIRPVDPAELIDRAISEAKARNDPADRKIEVTIGDVPLVNVDARQASRALAEVIENALQATDAGGGEIQLHAGYDPYSSRVVVTVTDNGCGMDEPTQRRAFDPFFSAKPAGRRRGLGLAKAQRWLEASGGSIRLESRTGEGTRAILLLPAPAKRAMTAAPESTARAS